MFGAQVMHANYAFKRNKNRKWSMQFGSIMLLALQTAESYEAENVWCLLIASQAATLATTPVPKPSYNYCINLLNFS